MMQRKSGAAHTLLLLFVLWGIVGCGSPPPNPVKKHTKSPFHGKTLTVACGDKVSHTVVSIYSRNWAAKHHATVKVVPYPTEEEMAAGDVGVDAWIIPAATLGLWATTTDLAEPATSLQESDDQYQWIDLLPIFQNRLMIWKGRTVALPLLGECPLCFYRADLLEDKQHQQAFKSKYGTDLKPPETWSDYLAIAEYFSTVEPCKPHSLPPLPMDDESLDRAFYRVTAPYARRSVREADGSASEATEDDLFSFHFDLHTGKPLIAGPGFVEGLDLLQRLQPLRATAEDGQTYWKTFANGKSIFCVGETGLLSHFQKSGSAVQDKVAVCSIPGTRFYFDFMTGKKVEKSSHVMPYSGAGSQIGIVPSGSSDPEAAYSLLADLSSPKLSQQIVTNPAWGARAIRREHRGEEWHSLGLSGKRRTRLQAAIRENHEHLIRNEVIRLRVPRQHKFMTALVKEIRSSLLSKSPTRATAKAALKRAEAAWEKLIAAKGVEKHRNAYRISQGLSPLD